MSVRALPWTPNAAALTTPYGLAPRSLSAFVFWSVDGDPRVWMTPHHAVAPADAAEVANLGWPVLADGRPTRDALRIVGADATRNVLAIDAAQAAAFHAGEPLPITAADYDAPVLVVRRGHLALGGVDVLTGRRVD